MSTGGKAEESCRGVLAAAGRVLRERGLQGVRVREIATSAGMSPGAVLYHYPNTKALLFAVHEEAVRQYTQRRSEAQSDDDDPRSRLLNCFRAGVPPFADNGVIELLYEMHGLARHSHRHAELLTNLWTAELAMYVDIIQAGLDQGAFATDNVELAARTLLALEDGLVLHLVSSNERLSSALALEAFREAASLTLRCPSLARTSERRWKAL